MNKTFWFVTLPAFLKSKAYIWGLFTIVVVLGLAYFLYAWYGHAPTKGPDQTDPWKPPVPGVAGPRR